MAGPSTKLLALGTAAVGAIYATGYVVTEPTAKASSQSPSASAPQARRSVSPSHHTHSASAKATVYKDGQYTGSGSNQYGTLSVLVTVKSGKVTSVKITSYAMHYPQSFINPQMPKEVISKQTWRVYVVSGATASSYNFAEAVYYALKKAQA